MKTYCTIQALAVNTNGKYLVTKRAKGSNVGDWRPVTGYIQERESAEECAVRELKEETGLKGKVIIASLPYWVESGDKRFVNVSSLLLVEEADVVELDRSEASDYQWIEKSDPIIDSSVVLKKVMQVLKII